MKNNIKNDSSVKWIAKTLNRKGDFMGRKERMQEAYPDPKIEQIVWLDGEYKTTGYKVVGFKMAGSPIWQRYQIVWH
jgi:hypothetical protein